MAAVLPDPLAGTLLLSAVAVGGLSLFPRLGWLADLVSQFRLQLGISFMALGLIFAASGRLFVALILTSLALAEFGSIARFLVGSSQTESKRYSLVLFNVRMRNRRFEQLLGYVLRDPPDILALVEVDQGWIDGISRISSVYAYQAHIPHPASYGLAIYSQFPIVESTSSNLPESDVSHLDAELLTREGKIRILLAHLPPPFSPGERRKRDERLAGLARLAAEDSRPCLLMGDFNATPWTPSLLESERARGLESVRRSRGFRPSWPVQLWPARIPIDHVLATRARFEFGPMAVGPDLGSDHFPIVMSFEPRARLTE